MASNKQKAQKNKVMERNVIAKNTSVTGDIVSEGDFRIDGTLEGNLKTDGKVIIGSAGTIKGKVESNHADIEGRFSGDLLVNETLTVRGTASIFGDVVVGKLSVEPGATFNATCSMRGAIKELNQHEQQRVLTEKTA